MTTLASAAAFAAAAFSAALFSAAALASASAFALASAAAFAFASAAAFQMPPQVSHKVIVVHFAHTEILCSIITRAYYVELTYAVAGETS